MATQFELGTKLRDRVSGFTGVAVSVTSYLGQCDRYALQPEIDKDGKLPQTEFFDENQLEVVDKRNVIRPTALASGRTGGYQPRPR